jgi:hypothetical protein
MRKFNKNLNNKMVMGHFYARVVSRIILFADASWPVAWGSIKVLSL